MSEQLTLSLEVYDTLAEAKKDGHFDWACVDKGLFPGKVGIVWKATADGGQTGLPGIFEGSEEYARRIVACVNACAGMDTEILEVAVGFRQTANEVYRLNGQNAKLLEDIENALNCLQDEKSRERNLDVAAEHILQKTLTESEESTGDLGIMTQKLRSRNIPADRMEILERESEESK